MKGNNDAPYFSSVSKKKKKKKKKKQKGCTLRRLPNQKPFSLLGFGIIIGKKRIYGEMEWPKFTHKLAFLEREVQPEPIVLNKLHSRITYISLFLILKQSQFNYIYIPLKVKYLDLSSPFQHKHVSQVSQLNSLVIFLLCKIYSLSLCQIKIYFILF